MVDRLQHGVGDSHIGTLRAAMCRDPLVLGAEIAVLDLDRRVRTDNQGCAEQRVPLGGPAGETLASALVVAGAESCPLGEAGVVGEALEVIADDGDDSPGRVNADAGSLRDLLGSCLLPLGHGGVDHAVDGGDALVEVVDMTQDGRG